jgi:2-(1,2-epoxy-1,2-dihydrophenyl)acetyl-CoA isomerase
MVNRVLPHEELMDVTYELAGRIADNAPIPIALAKRALQNFNKTDLAMALDYEAYALDICAKSEDFMEGFKSFLEKRQPVFKGR